MRPVWWLAALVVVLEVPYPLLGGGRVRDVDTVLTVVVFALASCVHAQRSRGPRYLAGMLLATVCIGFAAEVVGVHTGYPFGHYRYGDGLGPELAGVPVVIPLAWAMMAHPAACVALRLCRTPLNRWLVGAWALASWDLFLDPQMVAAGQWSWRGVGAALPGVPQIPLSNYLGWLLVAAVVMAALVPLAAAHPPADDRPVLALWLWSALSSALAAAAFMGRPLVAVWGLAAMGVVAFPLVRAWWRGGARWASA
jgi:putative membrane protein